MTAMKQEQPVSFMCEHTVEFALVPKMIHILTTQFPKVIPIYFWATREGSRISRECTFGGKFRVVAVFPRRPKVLSPGDNRVFVKFNQQLFQSAHGAEEAGIPVLAGIPLVSSLMDFGLHCHYAWFQIRSKAIPQKDLIWEVDLDGNIMGENLNNVPIEGPLDDDEILDIVHTATSTLSWDETIERIRMVRPVSHGDTILSRFFDFGYKPTFFVMLES
jgi:hypothetical protein